MDIVNEETAILEFERFAESMCIEIDTSKMGLDDVESFEEQKVIIVKAICNNSLIITETGEPVYTPVRSENKNPITFYEPKGSTLAASDRRSKNQEYAKLYETMGALTKTHAGIFSKMSYSDLKICSALTILFLV